MFGCFFLAPAPSPASSHLVAMRCFCCAESAESEVVLPPARDMDDVAPISKAAIGSPARKAKTFQVG